MEKKLNHKQQKEFSKSIDNWFESMLGKDWKKGNRKNAK